MALADHLGARQHGDPLAKYRVHTMVVAHSALLGEGKEVAENTAPDNTAERMIEEENVRHLDLVVQIESVERPVEIVELVGKRPVGIAIRNEQGIGKKIQENGVLPGMPGTEIHLAITTVVLVGGLRETALDAQQHIRHYPCQQILVTLFKKEKRIQLPGHQIRNGAFPDINPHDSPS